MREYSMVIYQGHRGKPMEKVRFFSWTKSSLDPSSFVTFFSFLRIPWVARTYCQWRYLRAWFLQNLRRCYVDRIDKFWLPEEIKYIKMAYIRVYFDLLNFLKIHASTLSRFVDKISKLLFQREIYRWNIITFFKW